MLATECLSFLQQLSVSKSSSSATPTNLVNFEVSVSGLSMTDPQKRLFSRKNFSVKHITYVVRIRCVLGPSFFSESRTLASSFLPSLQSSILSLNSSVPPSLFPSSPLHFSLPHHSTFLLSLSLSSHTMSCRPFCALALVLH